jgi:hypothetical protein
MEMFVMALGMTGILIVGNDALKLCNIEILIAFDLRNI